MFVKWLVNFIVSTPVYLAIATSLLIGCAYAAHCVDQLGDAHRFGTAITIVLMGVGMVLVIVTGIGALLFGMKALLVLIEGEGGFLCRRVDEYDSLHNPDGSVFREFKETDLIWRWNPIFNGRELRSPVWP